jgi:uncharacterized integral membrane protein
MRFIKITLASLLGILALIFIIQNKAALEQTLQLHFDLYFRDFQGAAVPFWLVMLFAFFLGVFTASLYGIYQLIVQRQTIRRLKHNLEILGQELKRAGAPAELAATSSETPASPREE